MFNGLLGLSATSRNGTYFTRDPAGNLISMRQGQASYYTLDALGSVIALTDSTGNTDVARYSYDPYGKTTVTPGASIGADNPFRYASGYSDDTLGLYKFGARYFDPGLGRWTQREDPFSGAKVDAPSPNRFAYSDGDPT